MAASIAGALKALLEGAGLGVSVYRDQAPSGAAFPYITIHERISLTKSFSGNGDFGGTETVVEEQVQVSTWEHWRNPTTNALAESYTLAGAVADVLDGAVLIMAPKHTHGVRLSHMVRLLEEDNNVVQNAITIQLARML